MARKDIANTSLLRYPKQVRTYPCCGARIGLPRRRSVALCDRCHSCARASSATGSAQAHSLRRREAAAGGRGEKSRPRDRQKKKPPDWVVFLLLVAGVGFEPHDLRVMSPTSYLAALPRDMKFWCRRTGSNRHGDHSPRDFKSRVSANSTTPAYRAGASRFTCPSSIPQKSPLVNPFWRKTC